MSQRILMQYPGDKRIAEIRRTQEKSKAVLAVQRELQRRGLKGVSDDGTWDLATKKAVRRFQKAAKLDNTGVPDADTWRKLFGSKWAPPQGSGEKWEWLWRRPGVQWANDDLSRRLNRVGEKLYKQHGKRLVCVSGRRTMAQQWHLYNLWRAGKGNLAAYPSPNAPHIANGGSAYDCGVENKHGGNYTSIGNFGPARALLRAEGLALNVAGEPWHVMVSNTWRA